MRKPLSPSALFLCTARSSLTLCAVLTVTAYAQMPGATKAEAAQTMAQSTQAEAAFKKLYEQEATFRSKEFSRDNQDEDEEEMGADISDTAEQRRLKIWQDFFARAQKIDMKNLSAESRINLRIFSNQMQHRINAIRLNAHLLVFNSDSQFWASTAGAAESMRCKTFRSCEEQLQQLKKIAPNFEQKIALMKLGIARGMTQAQVVLQGRDASIARHLVSDVENSVFYKAFAQLPPELNPEQRSSLQQRAKQIINEKVIPAYRQLYDFIRNEYQLKARTSIAATDLPNGKDFYQAQIFEYTTLNSTPEEIHAIGVREVARIRADMHRIIRDTKFDGDFAAFLHFLRTDPQFYAKSEHELLAEASYWAKKADGLLPRYFSRLPRKPYGVAPVPADIAPTYTAGRYAGSGDPSRPSNYWVNTSLLNQRPMWALPALTLHEAVPGHHLQISLAGEQAEQPAFRRNAYISAFGEGWALYAEHLGVEMAYYETPYHHFGRLVYEMWRAARLVVDTGMHAKGWTREQAQQFMRENTALSEHEITTEIDRYISWPGQALAYKLGEIKIRELRETATRELGEKFDLRAFHDRVLSLGSVPLSVLEEQVHLWISTRKNPQQ